jgi:hypothetical protein
VREGRLFKDGFYFNKFKKYKINPQLLKKTDFKPLTVKDEKELAKKRNESIKDKKFPETIKIDMAQFLQTAEKLYGKEAAAKKLTIIPDPGF